MDKIKASELLKQMVIDSQNALKSEDARGAMNLIKLSEGKSIKSDKTTWEDVFRMISVNNDYIRFSTIKSIILTLCNLNIIDCDINITDNFECDKIINNALDEVK